MNGPSIFIFLLAVALLMVAGIIWLGARIGRGRLFGRNTRSNSGSQARSGSVTKAAIGRLRILEGSLAGLDVPVATKITLGRDATQAQIVFPDDDGVVSRLHCEIAYNNALSQFEVRDLGSRNGTFLVGESDKPRRLESDSVQRVAPGEKVLVGSPQNVLVLELC